MRDLVKIERDGKVLDGEKYRRITPKSGERVTKNVSGYGVHIKS